MKKLLLIEDDADSANSLAEQLAEQYEVSVARSGEDGLHDAQTYLPDIVLLDIILSGKINGFDVLRELKLNAKTSDIPVIILTNLDDQKNAALESGAEDCFIKANTTIDVIIAAIEKSLQKKAVPV